MTHINQRQIRRVRDFHSALRDIEPYVRNPIFLINGREFTDFALRPREFWANWLVCVVLRNALGDHITFGESDEGDGIIIDRITGSYIVTEHVSALQSPHTSFLPMGEDRVLWAINHKISKGTEYAAGKKLVVFFDGAGEFYRNIIREAVYGNHNFDSIYCVGLLTADEGGYSYLITEFKDSYGNQSVTFKVDINGDFTDWTISQVMQ